MHNWRPGETITAERLRSGYASGTATVPFSSSSGRTTVESSASSSLYTKTYYRQTVEVAFPAGAFTSPPAVALAGSTTSPGILVEMSATNITATGCTITGARGSTADTDVYWVAIEQS